MRYSEYDKMVYNEKDILKCKRIFEENIASKQRELSEFLDRANERVKWIKECEDNKKYCVLGGLRKSGKDKIILLIIRYEDGTQRDEKYSFTNISDAREKLLELKEKYSGVDWSKFVEEI